MKDVAKRAGVSQTTVSFVLNHVEGSNIPVETQGRIFAAIEELGYRPNAMARHLRSSRTNTIGFVSDVVATTPFAGQIIQGAQDAAWAQNYLLLVVNTGDNAAVTNAAVDTLLERRVDGILYATMYHRAVTPPRQINEAPTVLLDCFVEDRSLPSVVPDEFQGGYAATTALLHKGHRRIGFVNDNEPVPAMTGRKAGYRQALADFGVALDERLISHQTSEPAGGYAGVEQLLALPEPPTALFCFNDRMALGAYRYVQKQGLCIPEDLAIIGFDNQDMIAPYLDPPLTTMALPHYAMGQWAVNHLLQLIEQGDQPNGPPPCQHRCECPLITRASI